MTKGKKVKAKTLKKKCPRCEHEFKNFKWSWDYAYEHVARCPKCGFPAYKWRNYGKERRD